MGFVGLPNCVEWRSRAQLYWAAVCLGMMLNFHAHAGVSGHSSFNITTCLCVTAAFRWSSNLQCSRYCSTSQSWPTSYYMRWLQQTRSANEVHCLILLYICLRKCKSFGCQASLVATSMRHRPSSSDACIKEFLSRLVHAAIRCQLEPCISNVSAVTGNYADL